MAVSGRIPKLADHYHYFTHEDPKFFGRDITGGANRVTYTINGVQGKYSGSYCSKQTHHRTAISEYRGSLNDWEGQKFVAGVVCIFRNIVYLF